MNCFAVEMRTNVFIRTSLGTGSSATIRALYVGMTSFCSSVRLFLFFCSSYLLNLNTKLIKRAAGGRVSPLLPLMLHTRPVRPLRRCSETPQSELDSSGTCSFGDGTWVFMTDGRTEVDHADERSSIP